ncbi:MAG: biopolymer transporter ExbD [Acidobacteria bacterium]|nr:biopolymer transporter ExbD [Acidobacteriota bacterium]
MPFKKPLSGVNSEPNVVPMADIMLVLLIIFMVVTPMLQKGVSVELTQTTNHRELPDADKEDAVLVGITRDGNIFMGSDQTSVEDLTSDVEAAMADRVEKTVYVKSDARAKFETVVNAVDAIRSAGVEKLGLITEKVEPGMSKQVY